MNYIQLQVNSGVHSETNKTFFSVLSLANEE